MTTTGGIQGHYQGKSYAVLYSDIQSTARESGDKHKVRKLHAFPDLNYAFGMAGINLSDLLDQLKSDQSFHIAQLMMGEPITHNFDPNLEIALFLYSRLFGNSLDTTTPNLDEHLKRVRKSCDQFGEFAVDNPNKPDVDDPAKHFSDLAFKYLTMGAFKFHSTLRGNIRARNNEFFNLLHYALYDPSKKSTEAPSFIFSFNDRDSVELYAVTHNRPDWQSYFMWPRVTNFVIGSGAEHTSIDNVLAFGAIHDEIEMPLRDAIIHAFKVLKKAQSKDEGTAGFDITILREDGIIPYRGLIDRELQRDPKGMLETILNTPL